MTYDAGKHPLYLQDCYGTTDDPAMLRDGRARVVIREHRVP